MALFDAPRAVPSTFNVVASPSWKRAGYAVITPKRDAEGLLLQLQAAQSELKGPGARRFGSGRRSVVLTAAGDTEHRAVAALWRPLDSLARQSWDQTRAGMRWRCPIWVPTEEQERILTPAPHVLRVFHYPPGDVEHLDEHMDNGLVTVSLGHGAGLQVHDPDRGWVDIDKETHPGDVVVMVGETLQYASNGALPACRNRVVGSATGRTSAVYHLRAHPIAVMDSADLTTPQTGTFPVPSRHRVEVFMEQHQAGRENVNEEPT